MDRLLPIGSVVRVEGGEDPLMVLGFYPEADGYSYDYLATLYPQGLFETPMMTVFNDEDIASVLFEGFLDSVGEDALQAAKGYMDAVAERNGAVIRAVAEFTKGRSEVVDGKTGGEPVDDGGDESPDMNFRLG